MDIEIEDIKALDPGKIYAIEVDMNNLEFALDSIEGLIEIGKEHNINFIFMPKGTARVISAPEGLEIKPIHNKEEVSKKE